MKIGFVGYTNMTSGIGVFLHEFIRNLGIDSILSVHIVKGQERWISRQMTAPFPVPPRVVDSYLSRYRPDVVMFIETAFSDQLLHLCRQRKIKTVAIAMHETWGQRKLRASDLVICPCQSAYAKACETGANAKLMWLPISMKPFQFRERTGHVFVQNIGYNEFNDRRQTAKVVRAFAQLRDSEARLILNSQGNWPQGSRISDKRITYNKRETPKPSDNYRHGDIAILPMAYEGYGRTVLESMASGMPVLTTDADPMNLFQHDPAFLIPPVRSNIRSGRSLYQTVYHEVAVADLKTKMEWLMTIDTAHYSRIARQVAQSMSWESKQVDYRAIWLKTLKELCGR